MKRGQWMVLAAVAGIGGVLLTGDCDAASHSKWLRFFFDGVPPDNQGTNAPAAAPSNAEAKPGGEARGKPVPAAPQATYYAHPPFAEQKCAACHEAQTGQGMKKKTPELCFDCHKDFLSNFKVKHQPVETGDCGSCHDPHQSDNNKMLLLKTGKDLCFDCHENFLEKGKVKHQPAENGECLSCHNPHATDQKKLLTKSAPALCWDCHDNFLEKAKFKHDVVEDCTGCHSSHQSNKSKLLLKNAVKLCLDCHEEKDLKAVKGHADAEGKSCVICHDPHVGRDKNLLKGAKEGTPAK